METLKLIFYIVASVVITLLPQVIGLAGYLSLKKANHLWATLMAIVLPPLGFFALVYVYIKHEESVLLPTEYWLAVGFGFLVLYVYLVVGTILNLVLGLTVQLILFKRRRKRARPSDQVSLSRDAPRVCIH